MLLQTTNTTNIINMTNLSVATIMATFISFFSPIVAIIGVFVLLGIVNIIVGFIHSKFVEREKFRLGKIMKGIGEVFMYLGISMLMFSIGEILKSQSILGLDYTDIFQQVINISTCVIIYFYLLNIFQKLHELLPDNRTIGAIHYLISVEFLKKIPGLGDYHEKEKKKENKTSDNDISTDN